MVCYMSSWLTGRLRSFDVGPQSVHDWEHGSVGKSICQGSVRTSVWMPRAHTNPDAVIDTYNHSALMQRASWRQENPWKLLGQLSWHLQWWTPEDDFSDKVKGEGWPPRCCLLIFTCCAHTHVHTHAHRAHTYRETEWHFKNICLTNVPLILKPVFWTTVNNMLL